MTKTRIKFNNIVKNQLPSYVREEFPLISEFLSQYYLSQEFKGAPIDLIQNIDQYIKIDEQTNLVNSLNLKNDISFFDDTIFVSNLNVETGLDSGTDGFPESYGLIKIDDEIITYTGKTQDSFTGCIRGFSGISSIETSNKLDELTFSTSESAEHKANSEVINLTNLFLTEFLKKIKYQLIPGFEDRSFSDKLNERLFIKQAKDFYRSKGTDESFRILFKTLYGEKVNIIKPKENMISPSNAQYLITNDLVVESLSGDPLNLENQTLYQDEYQNISRSYAPITKVEKITSNEGKDYYKLSVDAGYNRDITVDGSIYGNFSIHPKTRVIGEVLYESTIIDVDSTIGFPNEGELFVTYNDGTMGVVYYNSKSLTQFLDCSNILGIISDSSEISINTYAYAKISSTEIIKVRINSVLKDVEIVDDSYYTGKGQFIQIKTLGVNSKDFISNNWIYNLATEYEIDSITEEDTLNKIYKINFKNSHIFRKGDSILIIDPLSQKQSKVDSVISDKEIIVSGQGNLSLKTTYKVKRNLLKTNTVKYPEISNINTNIQNIYKSKTNTLVTSPSIPSYVDQSLETFDNRVIFSGTFPSTGIASTDIFQITENYDHGFYTGDIIYYYPENINISEENPSGDTSDVVQTDNSLFVEGIYFIKRIDAFKVQFAKSASDILNNKFISINVPKTVKNNRIELYKFKSKSLNSQKLLREIASPIDDGESYSTPIGPIGILINGVEVLNYKSEDAVYYGPIESIDVTSYGNDYDIINPPTLQISDSTGIGATGFCSVIGNLKEIRIIDPGYDYTEIPSIKITGGNGIGAKASAVMKLVTHEVTFSSQSNFVVGIGATVSTIGFTTYHKFRNAERVIYDSNLQQTIGGLIDLSSYYVSVVNNKTIKLHKTENDAISGINTITLSSLGKGTHKLKSYNQKSILSSINIDNPGIGYQNKKKTTTSSGISTSLHTITIQNHEFNSGEIVKYTSIGSSIGGLISNNNYYLTKVDDNTFKLSEIDSENSDFYYQTKQYINFTSVGTDTHIFNYPNINVEVIGGVGISSIGSETFKAKVDPIFRGQIQSVHISDGGSNYGSADILNYDKQPLITLDSGFGAQLTPIISNGSIIEVLVNSYGKNYISPPDLIITGNGYGAVLTPILENGQIKSVKVLENGIGYSSDSTKITVSPSGKFAEFRAKIKKWTVNLFEKYFNNIQLDDGIISKGINNNYGLQYTHLYAPRKLRDIIYTTDKNGTTVYNQTDLQNDFNTQNLYHSPIIGWAYDGNPIYGPYGFIKKQGGVVRQLKSGYILDLKDNRPNFPSGFFIEDYVYKKVDDESVLDEHNGRFCVTPEFPNGTYAYFATFNSQIDPSGSNSPFIGFKRPLFPFIIGNTYKSIPNKFNFIPSSNQDDINLNETKWSRNTYPYNLINDGSSYSYLTIPNELNQTASIKFSSPGSIEKIEILDGGQDYNVNDSVIFDTEETYGYALSSKVSRIRGKQVNYISVASSTIYNIEFYAGNDNNSLIAISQNPHNFKNQDIISVSGLNTTSSGLEGTYSIGVSTNTLSIASSIGNLSTTGIVTYFEVSGNLSKIEENDILKIGIEEVKVLNIDSNSSRIKVLRQVNNSTATSHLYSEILYENPRKLTLLNSKLNLDSSYKKNKEIYFNPTDSVGLGTVGIGKTIVFSNPGTGNTQVFIPLKSIYIPNHKLETGDQLLYSTNGGSPLEISITGIGSTFIANQSIVYVAKLSNDLIGISTVRVGLGSTGVFVGIASTQRSQSIVYFTGIGTGTYHSFKTLYNSINGQISRNLVTVSTAQTHGLKNEDTVYVNVNPSISTSFTIRYNDYNRKVLVNPRNFISSDINTSDYSIKINNHGFVNGQKLIYTSNTPSIGLQNNKIYYAVIVDQNTIKLSDTYYNSISLRPTIVTINSTSNGTLSPINPPIQVYKNSTINFDLSDSSLSYINQASRYSAFSLDFYLDENFTKLFESSKENSKFEINRSGIVGISSNAKVTLTVNEFIPDKLYYKLNPIYNSLLPKEKYEVNVDLFVLSNNQIQIKESYYNGKHLVSTASSTSFTYNLSVTPESNSYISSISSINYDTDSLFAYGSISKIDIDNKGKNFYKLPGIISVNSKNGYGALLEAASKSIGKISKTKINDIGFDFPSDLTLRPSASLPQIIKLDIFSSFDFIGITSYGRGYSTAPKLIVIDGKTDKVIEDIDIRYNLGDSKVTIYKNTFGISNVTPKIIPTQNPNGVGISSISYNSSNKEVTLTLSTQYSSLQDFPFRIGDKILIENVNIKNPDEGFPAGTGYNSSDYGYKLFTVSSFTDNSGGGQWKIFYSLNGIIGENENPGIFEPFNSSARVIPEKYFPIFNIILKKNNFLKGEKVKSKSATGYVLDWNSKINHLTVTSKDEFNNNETVEGETSKSKASISFVYNFESYFNLFPYSKVENGWNTNIGFLNNNLQRIQDSDYYQNFSYSIKSRVDYDTWKDAVSTLNHTAGFKKFADYQLESSLSYNNGIIDNEKNTNKNSLTVGLSTNLTSCEVSTDIIEVVNLNCVYDFDLVSENSLNIGSSLVSDQIVFSSRVLTDYYESFGNRVLSIDDISSQFNSFPRSTIFTPIYRFPLNEARSQRHLIFVRDKRFTSQRQLLIATLLNNGSVGFMNQYGRIETLYDMGSFDFGIEGTEGILYFYPAWYSVNDYDTIVAAYNISDNVSGVGSTNIGGIVNINPNYTEIPVGSTQTIVGISSTSVISSKVLVSISVDSTLYEFDELNLVHDGTNIQFIEFGQLTSDSLRQYSSSGFGTYNAYYSGSEIKIDFTPTVGIGSTAYVNAVQVAIANTSIIGSGTTNVKHILIESKTTSIASSTSPSDTVFFEYDDNYQSSYCILQISDITNNYHQISEMVIIDDYEPENPGAGGNIYFSEFGLVDTLGTFSGIGTIGAIKSSKKQLTFTPNPNIDVQIKVYSNTLKYQDDSITYNNYNNSLIKTGSDRYFGTEREIRRSFDLTYKSSPIFQKVFDGSNPSIVDTENNLIIIPNHFFVTGEEIIYTNPGAGTSLAIGIATTSFSGIGLTDKLPSSIYAIKVGDNSIKLARNAEEALKIIPISIDITSVGVRSEHLFTAKNQNSKVIVAIDNLIQSPIVSTALTTSLSRNAFTTDDLIYFNSINSFFGGDLVKINDEIMVIEGVGIGSTNGIRVRRSWMGTSLVGHSTGSIVTKVFGNYNIIDNTLNFVEAPYGKVPQTTNSPNEKDWLGISGSSSFQGRVFLRSGTINSTNEVYSSNYIFDSISDQFNSTQGSFILKSNQSNISNVAQNNGVILLNDIFQGPGLISDYTLSENSGITSITFTGESQLITNDVGISSFPKGGIIVSVGSTEGYGYQPLIGAGGTAIISGLGTISSISIGNSGSGYRSGIQTVNVGVATTTVGVPKIEFIGIASISNGNIVSVAITNPGSGYTSTNPPYVVFDSPLSYSNIPLIYSSSSSGLGTQATIDIVVGQGSSVIDFEIKNSGYRYKNGEILTVPIGGLTGIPTTGINFSEFQVNIQEVVYDKFTGWTFGKLQPLDDISDLFDGKKVSFPIKESGNLISIISSKGSKINVQDTLLVFVNDVLQIPGKGYYFPGGSIITFSEPPKSEDNVKILFYKGTGDLDVPFRNILETVKIGDSLTIGYDSYQDQLPSLQEEQRTVSSINSTDLVSTNPYFGPGNVSDETLLRPVVWCRQTEDKVIDDIEIGKDRMLYEPLIYPSSYLIQSVGVGSTVIWVDNIRPFFNPINEGSDLYFQKYITIISQEEKIRAEATAVVSSGGTISSINITNGGYGYKNSPTITLQNPIGIGTKATAESSITSGIVTSINVINPGFGYTLSNPPLVLIESPTYSFESCAVNSFEGDFGIISGIAKTSVGVASTGITFDLLIPKNSFLRNNSVTGLTTISGISTGHYFRVYNSNVGNGVTSLSTSGSVIGIANSFVDNVYQVASVSIAQTSTIGLGVTYVAKVTVSVSDYNGLSGIGISNFYGEYSWGKISLTYRQRQNSYSAYPSGISTGALVNRSNPLKSSEYI